MLLTLFFTGSVRELSDDDHINGQLDSKSPQDGTTNRNFRWDVRGQGRPERGLGRGLDENIRGQQNFWDVRGQRGRRRPAKACSTGKVEYLGLKIRKN